MYSSDCIAIIALFIAIIVPVLQVIYGRRREWHEACELLCHHVFSLFDDIDSLVKSPSKVNHTTFQYHINRRLITLKLYKKRFRLQRNRIARAEKIIISQLMELPKCIEYEKLLLLGYDKKGFQHEKFREDIRSSVLAVSEALME